MNTEKFTNIVKLMTTYTLQIEELPDNLKCVKCKLVIRDACLVTCECTYCRICIDDMIKSKVMNCPGESNDCPATFLSTYVSDIRTNNSVSKLTAKCPHEGCVDKCQLVNMEEHLRKCQRKSEVCPFQKLGCTQDKLAVEDMSRHLWEENREHSELLTGMIARIIYEVERNRNEIDMLKSSNEVNREEIDMLKSSNEVNMGEIEMLKQKDQISIREIENLKRELQKKDEQKGNTIDREIPFPNKNQSIPQGQEDKDSSSSLDTEPELVDKPRSDELEKEIAKIRNELAAAISSIRDDILTINQSVQSINSDISSMKSQVQSIQALVGLVDARCELVIDKHVAETNWSWGDLATDNFTGVVYPYKYRLSLCNPGSAGGSLQIILRIHHGPSDGQLAWPFEGRVVITVAERNRHEACRSISRQCRIDKPTGNYYRSSDRFDFPHSVLIGAGLDLSRGVCVSCVIVPTASCLPCCVGCDDK